MVKYSKQQISPETIDEAMKVAKGIQKPGQTKEQTKLIAQGIQKGIDQYKKQQNVKARERDKQRKKNLKQNEQNEQNREAVDPQEIQQIESKLHWLPWLLLTLTWASIGIYFYYS